MRASGIALGATLAPAKNSKGIFAMAVTLNKAAETFAEGLIHAGHYDTESSWSFSAEDGDKLLGKGGDDWAAYARWHLGEDDSATEKTKERYKYPFGKDGKVFKRALDAIDSRATQNGDTSVDEAANRLKDLIAEKEKAKDGDEEKDEKRDEEDGDAEGTASEGDEGGEGEGDEGEDEGEQSSPAALALRMAFEQQMNQRRGHELRLRRISLRAMAPASLDEASRSIEVCASSGAAVRRYDWQAGRDFDEVLTVTPGAIRLGRFNSGAPLLDSHDYYSGLRAMIGAVMPGSARIEDGELRCRIVFSTSDEGERAWNDAKQGILRNFSVGYLTHKEEIDESTSPPTYRATDWEPHELSGCAIPADPKANVRSIASPRPERTQMTTSTAAAQDAAKAAAAARTAELERIRGIRTAAKRLGLAETFAEEHVEAGTALDAFRGLAIDKRAEDQAAGLVRGAPAAPAIIGRHKTVEMKPGHMAARLVRLMAAAKGDGDMARRICRSPAWEDGHTEAILRAVDLGFDMSRRALVTGVGAAGGFLVPEEYAEEVIELLRHRAVIRRLGAVEIPMAGGNLSMPRLNAGASATYVGEAVASNASQEQIGQLRFTSKKLMALVPVSNDLLKFSSPQADQVVLNDMVAQIAVAEDAAFIRGLGTQYSPRGIRYWAASGNVTASAGTGLTNTVTDIETLLNALEQNDVRMIDPAWIMNPRSKNSIRLLQTTTGAFVFREEIDKGTLMGYKYGATNNVPANLGGGSNQAELYLVDMADAVIADVPGLEIEVSSEAAYVDSTGTLQSAFSQDVTVMRAIERHDFGMRHDVSAGVLTGVLY